MAYINPTPADIKLDFPVFATVDDAIIQRRIDRSSMWVDESWFETDYTWAKELVTAHYLTLDGLGTGTAAELNAAGLSGVTRLKSGTLDVSFSDTSATVEAGSLESTTYGIQFLALLRKNKGGPRIAAGGGCGIAGQATDVPWAWRTNGFGV